MNTNMTADSKALVVYHKDDNDGVFSAAIVINYLQHELHVKRENIDTIKADYTTFKDITTSDIDKWNETYDNIIFTDISMNDTDMFKYLITTVANKFTWVDHHRPIIEWSMRENLIINGMLDISNSAIYNMFVYLYNPFVISEIHIPKIFRILSAWDSFNFTEYDKMYAYYVNVGANFNYCLSLDDIVDLVGRILYDTAIEFNADELVDKLYNDGKKLAQYEKHRVDNIIETCGDFEFTVNGRKACALFMQGASSSLMFDSVKRVVANGIVFKRQQHDMWVVSLYNTNDNDMFDCGKYCKEHFNGGGHKGAAGFTITDDTMKTIFSTKKL